MERLRYLVSLIVDYDYGVHAALSLLQILIDGRRGPSLLLLVRLPHHGRQHRGVFRLPLSFLLFFCLLFFFVFLFWLVFEDFLLECRDIEFGHVMPHNINVLFVLRGHHLIDGLDEFAFDPQAHVGKVGVVKFSGAPHDRRHDLVDYFRLVFGVHHLADENTEARIITPSQNNLHRALYILTADQEGGCQMELLLTNKSQSILHRHLLGLFIFKILPEKLIIVVVLTALVPIEATEHANLVQKHVVQGYMFGPARTEFTLGQLIFDVGDVLNQVFQLYHELRFQPHGNAEFPHQGPIQIVLEVEATC